jgi:methylglutaconyl-CoA hydratase
MTVHLETDARGVATVTFARPEVKNAFDARLIAELTERLDELDRSARCVVLRSEGAMFCAGADVSWLRSTVDADLEENLADSRVLAELFARLDDLPMPLLARVQGAALGGGAGLVAVADIAVSSADAVFAFTEVRLGILPAVVSPYVVRKVGPAHAAALFVTGMRVDARRAHEIGLVESIVPPNELDAALALYVDAILAGAPHGIAAAKRLVREVAGRDPHEVRQLTIERIAAARVSEEGQEGMRAFLERRKARWTR